MFDTGIILKPSIISPFLPVPNEICKALFYNILIKVLYHGFAPCGTINIKIFFYQW